MLLCLSRGWANNRLAEGTSVALQHNLGLGGCCVVTVYKRADGKVNARLSDDDIRQASAFSYNPAVEARYASSAEGDATRSRKARIDFALGDTLTKIAARM